MPEYNIPDPKSPDFNEKVSDLLTQLFDRQESNTLNLKPIQQPQDRLQIGSIWYDSETDTVKVNTTNGIRTVQFV